MKVRAELRIGLSALVVVGAACGDSAPVRSTRSPEIRLRSATQGLCDAEALAREGQIDAARARFFDRSHEVLHELAALVTDRDAGASAALLRAKERLEAILQASLTSATDPEGDEVAARIAELIDRLRAAARAAGLGEVRCPEEAA